MVRWCECPKLRHLRGIKWKHIDGHPAMTCDTESISHNGTYSHFGTFEKSLRAGNIHVTFYVNSVSCSGTFTLRAVPEMRPSEIDSVKSVCRKGAGG